MAVIANSSGQRVSRIRSLRMSVTVWKPISGRNSPKARSVVTPASRSARAISTFADEIALRVSIAITVPRAAACSLPPCGGGLGRGVIDILPWTQRYPPPARLRRATSPTRGEVRKAGAALPSHTFSTSGRPNRPCGRKIKVMASTEKADVLVVNGKIGRPHGLDQTDQDAADHRARQRADAAQDRGGERLHARHEAVGEGHHAVIHQVHGAGDGFVPG